MSDVLHVVHPRSAGLDVHKMQITATVRLCPEDGGEPVMHTGVFSAFGEGLERLVNWLGGYEVEAAVLEAAGVYWLAPFEALEEAGIAPRLVHAQHVKQLRGRKTDIADSEWLACVSARARPAQPCAPTGVPPGPAPDPIPPPAHRRPQPSAKPHSEGHRPLRGAGRPGRPAAGRVGPGRSGRCPGSAVGSVLRAERP